MNHTLPHCTMDGETKIYLYGATGATPQLHIGGPGLAGVLDSVHPVDVPDGVTGTNPRDKNGNYADLAMLNLVEPGLPNDTAWRAVDVTPSNSFYMVHTGPNNPARAVGTGLENDQPNPSQTMQFQPSEINSETDLGGDFETTTCELDHGDSGGPLFELRNAPAGGGLGSLILVGIAMDIKGFVNIGVNVFSSSDYVSVGFPSNYRWIQNELGPTAHRKMVSDYFLNRRRPLHVQELIPVGREEGWRRSDEAGSVFPELSSTPAR